MPACEIDYDSSIVLVRETVTEPVALWFVNHNLARPVIMHYFVYV